MKFLRRKESEKTASENPDAVQIQDVENLLNHRTQLSEEYTATSADNDDEYDFLDGLFAKRESAVSSKKPVKKSTVYDLLTGKSKKVRPEKQPPGNTVLRLCLILGIILAVLVASFAVIVTVTQNDEESSDGVSRIFAAITSLITPENNGRNSDNSSSVPEKTPKPTPNPTPVPTSVSEIREAAVSALTIPEGDYFDAGKQLSANAGGIYASEQNWETIHTAPIASGKWIVSDFCITVNPAKVPVYYQNKQYTTVVIQEPWRISWNVSQKGTDPYTSAELILYQYDAEGNIIQTYGFGWKGKYSADTRQITPEFQPGEYALALFLRGTGITLDFQQNKAMPAFDNLSVRET